jgi:hypothetical protein
MGSENSDNFRQPRSGVYVINVHLLQVYIPVGLCWCNPLDVVFDEVSRARHTLRVHILISLS